MSDLLSWKYVRSRFVLFLRVRCYIFHMTYIYVDLEMLKIYITPSSLMIYHRILFHHYYSHLANFVYHFPRHATFTVWSKGWSGQFVVCNHCNGTCLLRTEVALQMFLHTAQLLRLDMKGECFLQLGLTKL